MPEDVMTQLKACEQSVVKVSCWDGRTVVVRIVHVDEEYRDVLYNLIAGGPGAQAVYSPVSILPVSAIRAIDTLQA